MENQPTKKQLNELTYKVIGAAIEVHKQLGPGLLESVYQRCLKQEFYIRGISFISEMKVKSNYKGIELEVDLRCDFLVENEIVLEIKSVEGILPVHEAQVYSYMKLLDRSKGILINFNTDHLFKNGQKTFVNEKYRTLAE